ncbi:MAG TPA: hypothetical protein VHM26_06035 [Chitinophagaceae bacterium]|jgi:hypothetical protein|nr:hypothetical protein [Chitinophagaceae bacterium]
MNLIHKLTALGAGLFVIFNSSYSQTPAIDNSQPVSINLSIVGKGVPTTCKRNDTSYFISLRISNIQDTSFRFWIYSCSWAADNWIIANTAGLFRDCGCDINIPVDIKLEPKQSIEFYTTLRSRMKGLPGGRLKAGFLYFTNSSDLYKMAGKKIDPEKVKIFWSNEVEIKDNLYSYEIR